ncbi:MAG: 16S rRNA (cytosine(967)-C(5))-methyltransferase RsmB [Oscillospiraceae bacterium]
MITARFITFKLLMKMNANAYSNIILDNALTEYDLSLQDKKFASYLFYGVVERKITLDYVIQCYSSKPISKINKELLQILRMGIYQLMYMPSVPESAAVNECVNLTKQVKMTSATGFINAILRNFIRDDKKIKPIADKVKSLSVQTSCPIWLVEKWIADFGEEIAVKLLNFTCERPQIYIRVNTVLTNTDEVVRELTISGVETEINDNISDCIKISGTSSIERQSAFKKGYFHVQDISSQFCCKALNPQRGDVIFDLCAAPGGKTFTLAELVQNDAEIYAFDLHEKRVNLIKDGAKRLGLSCISAVKGNAKEFNPLLPLADKILCDVPCSGLGVIRKKPEIKYKNPKDLDNLPQIQYDILENAAKYLKVGGELVYSTCSLNKEENDFVIDKFLENHEEFAPCDFLEEFGMPFGDYKTTILPMQFNSDGFFISKIKKIH